MILQWRRKLKSVLAKLKADLTYPAAEFFTKIPSAEKRKRLIEKSIISFSGWRRVFAADGDEDSSRREITPEAGFFAAAAGSGFARWLKEKYPHLEGVTVAVACDARPTGEAIANCLMLAIAFEGSAARYLSISATPEALAYASALPEIHGLIIVTASHNPLGHNGLKFSAADGAVLAAADGDHLKEICLGLYNDEDWLREFSQSVTGNLKKTRSAVINGLRQEKSRALELYSRTMDMILVQGSADMGSSALKKELNENIARRPLGIVAELNGSARTMSIDRAYLESLGCKVDSYGIEPGIVSHTILPEGEALEPACRILERKYREDPSFELGYVPDMDGDRGNLVLACMDGSVRRLEAQEVFALAVVAELAFSKAGGFGLGNGNLAVVVNGPTSARIDRIAKAFGARVFRAEVGEANVLELARIKRNEGFYIPVIGEGSNGGSIIYPSAVRDPLATLIGMVRLLRLPGVYRALAETMGLAGINTGKWPEFEKVNLERIVSLLPVFSSTGLYEDKAMLKIGSADHDLLKRKYEEIFESQWQKNKKEFENSFTVTGYEFINYEGVNVVPGPGNRSNGGLGGFKVRLLGCDGYEKAFLWMRGSRTEPVFRLMADVEGGPQDEDKLLEIHRDILMQADR